MGKLIIDGKKVYELDEECMKKKKKQHENPMNQKMNPKKKKQVGPRKG